MRLGIAMYVFEGVFTRQDCSKLPLDPRKYTRRDLRPAYPFWGIRAHSSFEDVVDNSLGLDDAILPMIEVGLTSGLALSYATFGGPVEYLAVFEIQDSAVVLESRFESVSDSMDDELLAIFIEKMSGYGIPPEPTGFFFPFESDFWDE